MGERGEQQGRRRRTFVPALLLGLAAAGAVAVAGNQAWVEPAGDGPTGSVGQVAAIAQDASSPLTTAVALVALACWGVLLVTRGTFRRAIAWFGVVVAACLVLTAVLAWVSAPSQLEDVMAQYGVTSPDVARTWWSWLAVGATPLALAAALLAARDVAHWPQMGSRYDAPGASADDAAGRAEPPEEQSSIELWKSLDEGSDPTA
jgi:uncharacterized membrane protein (TIGR02234 family)